MRLIIDEITIVNIWSDENFIDNKAFLGRMLLSFLIIPIPYLGDNFFYAVIKV